MPNGFGLHGDESSHNSAVIVPWPDSSHLYYIFTTPAYAGHWTGDSAFEYALVDMNLNGGKGDVVFKNAVLFSPAIEQLGAVKHSNKKDYWVVAHEAFTNAFYTYRITSNGLDLTPVVSPTGFTNGGYTPICWGCAVSGLKFSVSGCRLSCTYPSKDTLEILDFDNTSGIVMNPLTLRVLYPWSTCFSPNNNLLYAGTYDYNTGKNKLMQYNLSSNTPNGILASGRVLSGITGIMATMQNAADGKIYCTIDRNDSLAVINNPNIYGTGCNFAETGFSLAGKICLSGITNFVQSFFNNDTMEYYCPVAITGIKQLPADIISSIAPNPFSENTTIHFTDNTGTKTLTLYNNMGQQVRQYSNVFSNTIDINAENLPTGQYYITVTNQHTSTAIRLTIAK
jgi:hypothetical protein